MSTVRPSAVRGHNAARHPGFELGNAVILKATMSDATAPSQTSSLPDSDVLMTLSDGAKVKRRLLRMRACNERNAKGKLCAGHLKRWFKLTEAAKLQFGANVELYRCERCHTIYLPNAEEQPRTAILSW